VKGISKQRLRERFQNDSDFAETWTAHLAHEVQAARIRSEVLSLKTVAARLSAWLAWVGELPAKGEWKQLAEQIGVSPEALYREIAKARRFTKSAPSTNPPKRRSSKNQI
jgi:CRP-like cAMP-binding protein